MPCWTNLYLQQVKQLVEADKTHVKSLKDLLDLLEFSDVEMSRRFDVWPTSLPVVSCKCGGDVVASADVLQGFEIMRDGVFRNGSALSELAFDLAGIGDQSSTLVTANSQLGHKLEIESEHLERELDLIRMAIDFVGSNILRNL